MLPAQRWAGLMTLAHRRSLRTQSQTRMFSRRPYSKVKLNRLRISYILAPVRTAMMAAKVFP